MKTSQSGFSLIELMVVTALLSVSFLAVSEIYSYSKTLNKRARTVSAVLALESRLVSAILNKGNFAETVLRAKMQDGAPLPAFSLYDISSQLAAELPAQPRTLADISPGTLYMTLEGNKCDGFDHAECVVKIEASLLMVGGPTHPSVTKGPVEWIVANPALAMMSVNPVYAAAYRISVDPQFYSMKSRGLPDNKAFGLDDHKLVLPYDHYALVGEKRDCGEDSYVAGIDPNTKEPICLKRGNFCRSKTLLAKQIAVKDNMIGIDCAEWKKFECPNNYVVEQFSPSMLDSDRNGSYAPAPNIADYGRCVYIGKDADTFSSQGSNEAQVNCSSKYDVTGSCSFVNLTTTTCSKINMMIPGPASVPAIPSTVSFSNLGSGDAKCTETPPTAICPAGYSGGSWNADVSITATCALRNSEKYRAMIISDPISSSLVGGP